MNAYKASLLLPLLLIQSCSTRYVKPEIEPLPPLVSCQERKPLDSIPEVPTVADYRVWATYAVSLLGLIEQGEGYRLATAECLDTLRKDKAIR